LKAKTVISYDLGGGYKTFRGFVGVDASIQTPSKVKLTILADDVPLYTGNFERGGKALEVVQGIQNVKKLTFIVESVDSLLDLGNQVTIAEARAIK
jgi:hypothetical protein